MVTTTFFFLLPWPLRFRPLSSDGGLFWFWGYGFVRATQRQWHSNRPWRVPSAWRPGTRCSWALRTCKLSSRFPNIPGCSWRWVLCLNRTTHHFILRSGRRHLLRQGRWADANLRKQNKRNLLHLPFFLTESHRRGLKLTSWSEQELVKNEQTFPNGPLTCRDVDESEQPHPSVSVHRPLLRLTVGLTAVVHESSLVPFGPGINDPILTHVNSWQRSPVWFIPTDLWTFVCLTSSRCTGGINLDLQHASVSVLMTKYQGCTPSVLKWLSLFYTNLLPCAKYHIVRNVSFKNFYKN